MLWRILLALVLLVVVPARAEHVGPISPATPNTITTGGTWQVLFAANTNRATLWIQNYCSSGTQGIGAPESLFIYFLPSGAIAPTTQSGPSLAAFELTSCGSQTFAGNYMTKQAVYVLGASTNHAFAAWQAQ